MSGVGWVVVGELDPLQRVEAGSLLEHAGRVQQEGGLERMALVRKFKPDCSRSDPLICTRKILICDN